MFAITVGAGSEAPLVWTEVPDPVVGPGQILVRVAATAVNRADLLQRRGRYPAPPGAPPWLGLEAAGVIEQLGDLVTGHEVGDRVCALLAGGGYAERVAVDARHVLPIPAQLSFEEGAALPEVFATAYMNLVHEARLREGEKVLVYAGASGVGSAAIQLARSRGAHVTTIVGGEAKARFASELGAAQVIDHHREDVTEQLQASAADRPFDVALDCVGGPDLGRHLALLAPGGRWIVIALMGGRETALDLRPLLSRRLRVIGNVLRPRSAEEKAAIMQGLRAEVWPLFAAGRVRAVVHQVFPIYEAEAAHGVLERRENIGKVVLSLSPRAVPTRG